MRAVTIVGAFLVFVSAGCRKGEAIRGDHQERDRSVSSACPLTGVTRLSSELRLPADCRATLNDKGLTIAEGGKLIVEAGVELSFGDAAELRVDGGSLTVLGTDAKPVRFAAAVAHWRGVTLERGPASSLSHLVIADVKPTDDAERQRPALALHTGSGPSTLEALQVVRSDAVGIVIEHADALARADRVTVEVIGDRPAMRIAPDAVGNVTGFHATRPIEVTGQFVRKTATWSQTDAPLILTKGLMLDGVPGASPTVLTIAKGNTIRLPRSYAIEVGRLTNGALKANGVRFDSAEATPAAGDWRGFQFDNAAGSELSDCTIAHAGVSPSTPKASPIGVVRVRNPAGVTITRTHFVDDVGVAIDARGGCASYTASAAGNDFGKLTGCFDADAERRAKLENELSQLEINMLSALGSGTGGSELLLGGRSGGPGAVDLVGAGRDPAGGGGTLRPGTGGGRAAGIGDLRGPSADAGGK